MISRNDLAADAEQRTPPSTNDFFFFSFFSFYCLGESRRRSLIALGFNTCMALVLTDIKDLQCGDVHMQYSCEWLESNLRKISNAYFGTHMPPHSMQKHRTRSSLSDISSFFSMPPRSTPFFTPVPSRPTPTRLNRSTSSSQSLPTVMKCE